MEGASVYVNEADVDGITPLHLAASEGHDAAVAALIDYGGKVRKVTFLDRTAQSVKVTPLCWQRRLLALHSLSC